MQYSGSLFLTATGLSALYTRELFIDVVENPAPKHVAIVTTAVEDKGQGKEQNAQALLAREQLALIGFTHIDFVDLEATPAHDFSSYHVIYVCGGNTFYLLHHARIAHFGDTVRALLERGGVYMGVSAGAVIMGASVEIISELDLEPNTIGLTDFTGLGLTHWGVLPHFTREQDDRVHPYEARTGVRILRVSDKQSVFIRDGELHRIQ